MPPPKAETAICLHNVDYGYVLRENQLKDQIYFRFASVYEPFDPQRAKNIAQDALRVIDDRYENCLYQHTKRLFYSDM